MNWTKIIKQIGLSDYKLAKICECSRSAILKIRAGKTKNPRYEIAQKLLKLAGRE